MSEAIRFILNDTEITTQAAPGETMLDFVRGHQHLCGTKIGCREGDCGACTVLVGRREKDKLKYRSVTSCLMPLLNAAGRHIVTVEGVNMMELNPVQTAMAEEGATQCGFCTPGFVVSLTGFCLSNDAASPERALAAIDGNICRCTGYKSIERAALKIAEKMTRRDPSSAMHWLVEQGYLPAWFETIPERLQSIQAPEESSAQPTAQVMGGGTDLYVQRPEEMTHSSMVSAAALPGTDGFVHSEGFCSFGASSTASDLLAWSPHLHIPRVASFIKLVSSTPIRNMGTLGGNLVNASPIGDLTIFFLGLNAALVLRRGDEERRLPLSDFYKGYKDIDLAEGEYVARIEVRALAKDEYYNFEKVSKRTYLDIASVNTAARIRMDGDVIAEAHVSAGGVGPTPKRLAATSDFLVGKPITEETVRSAALIAQDEVSPISDVRGSADYKRLLLQQLIFAHFLTLFPQQLEVLV